MTDRPADTSAAVILCEGYYDRAFWTGLLVHHGGAPEIKPHLGKPVRVQDPNGKTVSGGRYGFRLPPDGRYVEVVPVGTESQLLPAFDDQVIGRARPPALRLLVFNYDPDQATSHAQAADKLRNLRERVGKNGVGVEEVDRLSFRIPDSGTVVIVCPWACDPPEDMPDEVRAGVPEAHTLERVVCAAYAAAHPERVAATAAWLADTPYRPDPPSAKGEAFSLMAKWDPVRGCENFYESIWERPETRGPLLTLLKTSDAWPAIAALLPPGG